MRRVPIDLAAFEALYESHGARMKSLALNVLGNRSDAEDAVQETFLRAYKNRQSFRSDAALWTWVYRILLNACHDIGRAGWRGATARWWAPTWPWMCRRRRVTTRCD
jgi:RNA polymerase sigma factor (sigma-70 family)